MDVLKEYSNFKCVSKTKSLINGCPILKFESLKSGMNITIAQIEGPMVKGFFTLATEAEDDDGLPHTLEHLIFLGSEDYPYKGVLDLLANRCLADGTNAWTDTDHTAYTVMTAGSEGFLNLLPIYIDHLLFPTLTDDAFITEVYHISGEGEDAGVVYSEMQACENKEDVVTLNALLKLLYPEPCGFRYETGGIMANLRDSTSNEKVRAFHKQMYRPENLHLIITGHVQPEQVFNALESIENKILQKGDRDLFVRPWNSPVPPMLSSREHTIFYPSDCEDNGIVCVGWRGPQIMENIKTLISLQALMKYLTETSVSPLPKVFVEVEEPLASDIEDSVLWRSQSAIILTFCGVPKEKICDVSPLLRSTLESLAEGRTPLDVALLHDVLHNCALKEANKLETKPHETFARKAITDFLYGGSNVKFVDLIDVKLWYEELQKQPDSYWMGLLKKYLVSSDWVVVRGVPSAAEARRLQDEERGRVKQRNETLGQEGLGALQKRVEQAKTKNEVPPPASMLESVPIPLIDGVNFHRLTPYTNVTDHVADVGPPVFNLFSLKHVSVKLQIDDVRSNFVQLTCLLDTSALKGRQRLWLPLLQELLLESSVWKGGRRMSAEEVVRGMNADCVDAEGMAGLSIKNSEPFHFSEHFQYIGINLKLELSKYKNGVEWLSAILFGLEFEASRAIVKATKLLNSVGDKKRQGGAIVALMSNDLLYHTNTNINASNFLRQEKFLNEVLADLKENPKAVVKTLTEVYLSLVDVNRITVHLASDLNRLSKVIGELKDDPWRNFIPKDRSQNAEFVLRVLRDADVRVPLSVSAPSTGYCAGVGSVESAYLRQSAAGVDSFQHKDLPALMVAISYLTQLEGPMWCQIRGRGLAYSYGITVHPSDGTIALRLAKAAKLTDAYREAVKIITSYMDGSSKWERPLLETARSSLIYLVVDREAEIADIVQQSIYAYYRQISHDYNRKFLRTLQKVSLEEVGRAAHKYLAPLVDPTASRTVVVCPPSKTTEVKTELDKMGHCLEIIETLEKSRFADIEHGF